MTSSYNLRPRVQTVQKDNSVKRKLKCRYCKCEGHNITQCEDNSITMLTNGANSMVDIYINNIYVPLENSQLEYIKIKKYVSDFFEKDDRDELAIQANQFNMKTSLPSYIHRSYLISFYTKQIYKKIIAEGLNLMPIISFNTIPTLEYNMRLFAHGLIQRLRKRNHLSYYELNNFIKNHLKNTLIVRILDDNISIIFERPTLNDIIQRLMTTLSIMNDDDELISIVQENLNQFSIQERIISKRQWNIKLITNINELENNNELEKNIDCPICYDCCTNNNSITLNCKHSFCQDCIVNQFNVQANNKQPNCAICRTDIYELKNTNIQLFENYVENNDENDL